jgi:hypothetical protein
MKKICIIMIMSALLIVAATVHAAEIVPLGDKHAALKLNTIIFTDSKLKDADVKSGKYIGFEGYNSIGTNLYLGAEVGYGYADGNTTVLGDDYDTKLYFIPLELNIKYALPLSKHFAFDFGGGPSYSFIEEDITTLGTTERKDDWVFGGQVFLDFSYVYGQFFLSLNSKYQFTGIKHDTDHRFNNMRFGGQIGVTF